VGKAKLLSEVPDGTLIFIDANIFHLYLRGPEAPRRGCTEFLERVERGRVEGVTSPLVLDELAYKLLLINIEERFRRNPLLVIRENPAAVSEAAGYVGRGLSIVLGIENLTVLGLERLHAEELTTFMERHSLLPRDSLHLAVMFIAGCRDIASADRDFDRAETITRWSPTD